MMGYSTGWLVWIQQYWDGAQCDPRSEALQEVCGMEILLLSFILCTPRGSMCLFVKPFVMPLTIEFSSEKLYI